jgi:hypothetical protein
MSRKACVDLIAGDVGRLRLRSHDRDLWLIDRLAGNVENLDCMLHPSAAEIMHDGTETERAIAIVDARSLRLRELLGTEER